MARKKKDPEAQASVEAIQEVRKNLPKRDRSDRIRDHSGNLTMCTPELISEAASYRKQGLPVSLVADVVGIQRSTIYEWLSRKEDGHPYDKFAEEWAKAEVEFVLFHFNNGIERDPGFSWKLLSKTVPEFRDDPHTAVQVNVAGGDVSVEAARKELLRRAVEAAGGEGDE